MKIGILTFHWATNYGAVLQAYALQTYLESIGHEVSIINYKPKGFDNNIKNYILGRKFLKHQEYTNALKKENAIVPFRERFLYTTKRIYSCSEIESVSVDFDVIISGSDQVLNPSFLMNGDGRRKTTPSYFLGFKFDGIRVGYAVSFGVVEYPQAEAKIAKFFIQKFAHIGVRENTGIEILKLMDRQDAVVVPDPTILLSKQKYVELSEFCSNQKSFDLYCFFIRHIAERKAALLSQLPNAHNALWNNDDGIYSIEGWLSKIRNTKFVITDSFHCMVMCLKFHTPFAVVTELEGNVGMNDRLYTLLNIVGLSDRVVYKGDIQKIMMLYASIPDWDYIDAKLDSYKSIGEVFLYQI